MRVMSHNAHVCSRPFLMESNLKLLKIPRLHWTMHDALLEHIPQLLYRIEIQAY